MYLSESMEDMDGNVYPMVQAVPGNVYRTKKLGRFGYITLTPNTKDTFRNGGNPVRGHEFHYSSIAEPDTLPSVTPLYNVKGTEVSTPLYRYKNVIAGYTHWYWGEADLWKLWD